MLILEIEQCHIEHMTIKGGDRIDHIKHPQDEVEVVS